MPSRIATAASPRNGRKRGWRTPGVVGTAVKTNGMHDATARPRQLCKRNIGDGAPQLGVGNLPQNTTLPSPAAPGRPGRVLAARRHEEILARLAAEPAVGVADLAAMFGVSRETIRRDLKFLARRGRLSVVHGGAARRAAEEAAFAERAAENAAGKAAIGRLAAGLVENGMVVLLDSGTSTLALAEALAARRRLMICTASLPVARLLCRQPEVRVHLFGGEVDPGEEATTGIDVLDAVGRFRVDIAILGGGGLAEDGEVTDYTRAGAELRSRMIAAAVQAWFLLDQSKFGRLTPVRIGNFWSARGLIVDAPLPAGPRAALAARGLAVRVAGSAQ
jgi:DeoR family glycerol-3-phosphate regulon repressor